MKCIDTIESRCSIREFSNKKVPWPAVLDAIDAGKSTCEISDIIARDPLTTTKILRISNAAFFSDAGIYSTADAVEKFGLSIIKEIVKAVGVVDGELSEGETLCYSKQIFQHSALVNRYFPAFFRMRYKKDLDRSFQAVGITHHIGKIILLYYIPNRFNMILNNQNKHGMSFFESEIDLGYSGCTHADIGGLFLDYWNLPRPLVEGAHLHHSEDGSSELSRCVIESVCYMDEFVNHLWNSRKADLLDLSGFYLPDVSKSGIDEIAVKITGGMIR